jgi:hypothetical protein
VCYKAFILLHLLYFICFFIFFILFIIGYLWKILLLYALGDSSHVDYVLGCFDPFFHLLILVFFENIFFLDSIYQEFLSIQYFYNLIGDFNFISNMNLIFVVLWQKGSQILVFVIIYFYQYLNYESCFLDKKIKICYYYSILSKSYRL